MYISQDPVEIGLRANATIPSSSSSLLRNAVEHGIVRFHLSQGFRDTNELTNRVFFFRYPERQGRKLDRTEKDFASLASEWTKIRDQVVRPLLAETQLPLIQSKASLAPARSGSEPFSQHGGAPPALGTVQRLEHEAQSIVGSDGEASRWGVKGSLQDRLEVRRFMNSSNWAPRIPFRSANYQGANKCNIFALDLAWRCGFTVPVISYNYSGTGRRYTFPLANHLTTYAQRIFSRNSQRLIGIDGVTHWGWVETGSPKSKINSDIDSGGFCILVGWRRSGTGHVGVIRRIHSLQMNSTGRVSHIAYDGWEAQSRRASRLNKHEWRTTECGVPSQCQKEATNTASSFCAIHIIRLALQPNPAYRAVEVSHVDKCRMS